MCLSNANEAVYLDGLRKLRERGVAIMINGQDADNRALNGLFCTDDSSFYYGSFIDNPCTGVLEKICFIRQTKPVERSSCSGLDI